MAIDSDPHYSPIGVFDAGIGSYAVVEKLHQKYPKQDLIYLADRRSFPYGDKSFQQLFNATHSASNYLISQGCRCLVLASNAPSIVVISELKKHISVPIFGIEPPLAKACKSSKHKKVVMLGVNSMVSSNQFRSFIERERLRECDVYGINASPLVELVENFSFIKNPQITQNIVSEFIHHILNEHPKIDVITLSSTHLPWLKPFFIKAAPHISFLDPADDLVLGIKPVITEGAGSVKCIATANECYQLDDFNRALLSLNTGLAAELVII